MLVLSSASPLGYFLLWGRWRELQLERLLVRPSSAAGPSDYELQLQAVVPFRALACQLLTESSLKIAWEGKVLLLWPFCGIRHCFARCPARMMTSSRVIPTHPVRILSFPAHLLLFFHHLRFLPSTIFTRFVSFLRLRARQEVLLTTSCQPSCNNHGFNMCSLCVIGPCFLTHSDLNVILALEGFVLVWTYCFKYLATFRIRKVVSGHCIWVCVWLVLLL